ncbi:MAG: uracil-DNA glycosylase [Betaproteobacteria bacterium]|nr:uracil-DNA glycosylase [Betaproteobacteria bacterium]
MIDSKKKSAAYDAKCRSCARLAGYLDEVRSQYPKYFCAPVPAFGSKQPGLLIVGLAPGLKGANRTGRPFTGDHAGILLFATLHKFGFANHAGSADPKDGLKLSNCRITNAVKCLPPANKPLPAEIRRCNAYLANEIAACRPKAILALGRIAHDAVLMAVGSRAAAHVFAHGRQHTLQTGGGEWVLFDSYHCSRYNTQTRRLTTAMFESVVLAAKRHVDRGQ